MTTQHRDAFLSYDSRGRENDDLLKSRRYLILFISACYYVRNYYDTTDCALQKMFFDKAYHYYKEALTEMPNSLECLLHWARLIMSGKNIYVALEFLLPYEEQYKRNNSYNESMRKIYEFLKDTSKAEYYQKKFLTTEAADEWSFIFDDLKGPISATDNSLSERTRAAIGKFNHGHYGEAKQMIADILRDYPDDVKTLELALALVDQRKSDANVTTLDICDRILMQTPTSVIALRNKANIFYKQGSNLEDYLTAYDLYEKSYCLGDRNPVAMKELIMLSCILRRYQNHITYALENTKVRPSPQSYARLATAYCSVNQYELEIAALEKVRLLDKNFNNKLVSYRIVLALFKLAKTHEQYSRCAKKLSSYLARHPEDNNTAALNLMVKTFNDHNIHMPHITFQSGNKVVAEEKTKPVEQDSEWIVPEDVKAKILALLQNSHDTGKVKIAEEDEHYDPIEKEAKLYRIGGPQSTTFAYISSKAKTNSPAEYAMFEAVLTAGEFIESDSQGLAGVKQLSNGRFSIKSMHTGRRMLTNSIFSRPRSDGVPGDETILRFCPVKGHNQLNV